MGGAYRTYGGEERCIHVLVGKPEEKRARRTWKDNIKMDLFEVGCEGLDWIDRAQDMLIGHLGMR
jgi:hypothetical protein